MKKIAFLLMAAISILVSCRVDKSGLPTSTNNKTLNGMWYLKSQITQGFVQGYSSKPDTNTSFTKNDYDKFNTDNTVNMSMTGSTTITTVYYSVTTTQAGQNLTFGGTVTGGTVYAINKLTADSLKLFKSTSAVNSGTPVITYTTFIYTH